MNIPISPWNRVEAVALTFAPREFVAVPASISDTVALFCQVLLTPMKTSLLSTSIATCTMFPLERELAK